MNRFSSQSRFPFSFRLMACCVLVTFLATLPMAPSQAQMVALPTPGVRISVSPEFIPPLIKGITIHPENPLQFDFLMSRGNTKISGKEEELEYDRLIK